MIGGGKVCNGLYVLEDVPTSSPMVHQVSNNSPLESLHSWHRRCGHPSFGVLEHLFPTLIRQCNRSEFMCEPCELAKHKRFSYPISNQRSMTQFFVIHSDVWGPSRFISRSSYR